MILHYGYGENTYDEDSSDLHWGKYDNAMAKIIADFVVANGDFGDDEWSNPDSGEGWIRYGRRLFAWDSQGFNYCDTFPTVAAAEADRAQWWESAYEECEECGARVTWGDDEHECDGSGPLQGAAIVVVGWRGIAFRVVDHYEESDRVVAVMVGDDRRHVFPREECAPIDPLDYCHECGQIGCQHDGLDRSDVDE